MDFYVWYIQLPVPPQKIQVQRLVSKIESTMIMLFPRYNIIRRKPDYFIMTHNPAMNTPKLETIN